ncbi:hypothetical protein L1987_09214 [Smallanthus sonchifolius]|uniref:Uncharacterized protein n=1 Tax=Smallanthus sonchifolius TaxID=185202 RepID=A0ACB9JPG9_9ASTR|nr:hypothetical protein L1987_09214 [Smallanthus sonchifolius]
MRYYLLVLIVSFEAWDAPLHDPVIPDSPREGQVVDTSDSKSTESDNDDPDVERVTTTTQIPVSISTQPCPTSASTQVTPITQRLLDELVRTPPVGSSSSPSMEIRVSYSSVPPPQTRNSTRTTTSLRDESDDYTHMVSTIVELKARVVTLENLGESSCRQETVIMSEDDNDDPEGAHGGDEQPIASSMPSMSLADESNVQGESGGDGDKAEDVEIEFEQDDEAVRYATHKGVEFDTSFINQINDLARGNREEEIEKEGGSTEKSSDPSVDVSKTWTEKKKACFKTVPKSPPMLVIKSKYMSRTEATGDILNGVTEEAVMEVDGLGKEILRINDSMSLINFSSGDLMKLNKNKILYHKEWRIQGLQYQGVVDLCVEHKVCAGSRLPCKWKDDDQDR